MILINIRTEKEQLYVNPDQITRVMNMINFDSSAPAETKIILSDGSSTIIAGTADEFIMKHRIQRG